jgi:hypothetical protein
VTDEPADAAAAVSRPGGETTRPAPRAVLLPRDPAGHAALTRWAADELRSVNAQIELVLRRGLADAGRAPTDARPIRRPGRPRAEPK